MDKITAARMTRIKFMISKMTLEEKISQLNHISPAIERLEISQYNWWNEGLHGVGRGEYATIFPQAIALAATFDTDMIYKVASAISDEARAKYNNASKNGKRGNRNGLTLWAPNINIFRDPRWGRGQETFGEDPHLTASMGVAFVKGIQGDNPYYLKTAACAKHFAVHSCPEKFRHSFNVVCNKKDLHETYLPAFFALVQSGVEAVMGAYNRVFDEPCCASKFLLQDILCNKWKFSGHVVSDCWAIRDFHEYHKITDTAVESAAMALNNGCDLSCGCSYTILLLAIREGLTTEKNIDTALSRLLMTRFKLGMFEHPENDPYSSINMQVIDYCEHRNLAKTVAEKSIVLLKNDNNILPLTFSEKKILIIGPGAANIHTLIGNYHGLNPRLVTILEGIIAKTAPHWEISVNYHQGCGMYDYNRNTDWTIGMTENADVVIAVFGLDNALEGEEGDAIASDCKGDRDSIELSEWQLKYLCEIRMRGKPLILILTGGSPIAIPYNIADAILYALYPGEEGGTAVADILFGNVIPSGKLPFTIPQSTAQLPPYNDYSMQNRTYRFMSDEPLFPFGFGLSYTSFRFSNMQLSKKTIEVGTNVQVKIQITNCGFCDADEVIQIYVQKKERTKDTPIFSLKKFSRIKIPVGKTQTIRLRLEADAFTSIQPDGSPQVLPGTYFIFACNSAPIPVAIKRGSSQPVCAELHIV